MNQCQIMINTDKCVGCGLCSEIYVAHNLVMNNSKVDTVMDDCVMCGQCSAFLFQRSCGDCYIGKG